MKSIEIKTSDPRMAAGIAEGAATVALREVEAENQHLRARDGVRREADDRRWERTRRRLEKKYSTRPVGRARGAILGAWGLLWLEVAEWVDYFRRWNRDAK